MKRSAMQLVLIVTLVFIAVVPVPVGAASGDIKLGILPRLNAVELHAMFTPLAEYLSKETGEKVSLVIPQNFDAFKAAVRSEQVDIGFANSIVYIQLKKDMDITPVALSAERKAGTKFRGIIIVRKDSGIEKIEALKGKRLIFVEKDSAGGYIFQMLLLSKAGLDVHKDFITLPFAKKHDNVTMAVFNKAADAGGIREDDFEKMKSKLDISQLRIIGYSDYFPNWPLFSTSKLPKETATQIQAALLKLKPNDPESTKILGPAQLVGFVPVTDKDYDQLRQAAKLVGAF